MRTRLKIAVLMAATLLSAVAVADNYDHYNRTEELPQQRVRFDDLNLSNDVGIERLYGRVRSAARSVCNVDESQKDLKRWHDAQQCMAESVRRGVTDIGNARLSAYWMRHDAYGKRSNMIMAKTP